MACCLLFVVRRDSPDKNKHVLDQTRPDQARPSLGRRLIIKKIQMIQLIQLIKVIQVIQLIQLIQWIQIIQMIQMICFGYFLILFG